MNSYGALCLFCFSTSITPGPNNLMLMMSGLNYGVRRSVPHYLGVCGGFAFMLLIIGIGLGSAVATYPRLQHSIKIIGAGYMLYLAWKTIFSSSHLDLKVAKRPVSFMAAVLFQWANPKAWIMAIGVFATFATVDKQWVATVLIITLIFSLLLLPCLAIWLYGGSILKRMLKTERQLRQFNLIMGLLLALSIVLIFI